MSSSLDRSNFFSKSFWIAVIAVGLWINASEIFRYFLFIMPMMRSAFPMIEDVAPINWGVFLSWMIWDTVLILAVSGFVWLYFDRFGGGVRNAIIAGSLVWAPVFLLLWLGLLNMNMATAAMVALAWPLSWIEMIVAALIIDRVHWRF